MNTHTQSEPRPRLKLLLVGVEEPGWDLGRAEEASLMVCATVDEAIELLSGSETPSALVMGPTLLDGRGLEVAGALETTRQRIPLLILHPLADGFVPDGYRPSHYLRFCSELLSLAELERQAAVAVRQINAMPALPLMRSVDYVFLAVALSLSVNLKLHFRSGGQLQVKIIGGDVWSCFGDRTEGMAAFLEHFLQVPDSVEAKPIQVVPSQRLVKHPGRDFLTTAVAEHARILEEPGTQPVDVPRASSSEPPRSAEPSGASKTQPVPTTRDESPAPPSAPPAPSAPSASPPANAYQLLFNQGMEAALARRYSDAARLFEQALEEKPGDSKAQFNLERMRKQLGGGA